MAGGGGAGETSATVGGGAGGVQPGGGGLRVQHIGAASWSGKVVEFKVSRIKKMPGLAFVAWFEVAAGGGPLGKYVHFGFAPEFGANGTTGGTSTQLSIIY